MFTPPSYKKIKCSMTIINNLPKKLDVLYDDDTTVILERNTSISVCPYGKPRDHL